MFLDSIQLGVPWSQLETSKALLVLGEEEGRS